MRSILTLAAIFLGIVISIQVCGTTWYVAPPPAGSDSNPGTQEEPFATIQKGIDAASNGDTVIVAEGTYVENIEFKGKNIILTSTDPGDSDVVAKTIIRGGGAGPAVRFSGTENENCALQGFTLRGGGGIPDSGAGICGGTYGVHTRAAIRSNVIAANCTWSGFDGGGIAFCDGAIRDNVIKENWGWFGGGLFLCMGTIENNLIVDNRAGDFGGGLCACHGTIRNNVIARNRARLGGGLEGCVGAILSNLITLNVAGEDGGAIRGGTSALIENNTIVANSAGQWGGAIADCSGTIMNCVIWGNTAGAGPEQLYDSCAPTHCCIEGWTEDGEGNISPTDPGFVDPNGPDGNPATYEDNNYRLKADSPCIDKGKNEAWMWDALDPDGNPRVLNGIVDMGAYEYVPLGPSITGVSPEPPFASADRQWLTIKGVGFAPNAVVILRLAEGKYPIPADRTQFKSPTQIDVLALLSRSGVWSAQVRNPVEGGSNIFPFEVEPATPTVSGIQPSTIYSSPDPQWIAVNGTGYARESRVIVLFGEGKYLIPLERTVVVSSTEIRILAFLCRCGDWGVQVVNPKDRKSQGFSFNVEPATPTVSGIEPSTIYASPDAQWITVRGTGYGRESRVIILLGAGKYPIPPERMVIVSSEEIRALVYLKRPDPSYGAQIKNPLGRESNIFRFAVNPPPLKSETSPGETPEAADSDGVGTESELLIVGASVDADTGDFILSWPDVAGSTYQVEVSEDLQNWFAASAVIEPSGDGLCLWRDIEAATYRCRFYRVVVLP